MLKIIKNSLFVLPILVSLSSSPLQDAEAKEVDYLYNCNISFKAKGRSVRIIGGYTRAEGTGVLSCFSYSNGSLIDIPLKISVNGVGLGLGVSGFNINGAAVGIGVNKNPESLLGTYAKISADAALGLGLRTGVSGRLNFKKGSAIIGVEFSGQSGVGIGVDLLEVKISRDESRVSGVVKKRPLKKEKLHKDLKRIDIDDTYYSDSNHSHEKVPNDSGWEVYDESKSKWQPKKKTAEVKLVTVKRGDIVKIVDRKGRLVRKLKID